MTTYVDIHGHCVQEHFVPYLSGPCKGWHQISDPAEMLEFYDSHGVEKGVILPLCNAENAMQSQSNEEVLNIVKMHPDRFIPFCNVDPRNLRNVCTSNYLGVLKWYRDKGCKGLGEMCCNLHFSDARVQALLSAAEEVGFPVIFHMAPFSENHCGLVDEDALPELEVTLKRFPRLKLVGHSQAFWSLIGTNSDGNRRFGDPSGKIKGDGPVVQLMRKYPNLCGDLSGLSGLNALARDRAYAAKFLTEFQDRLLFGMDIRSPEGERAHPNGLGALLGDMLAKGEIARSVFNRVARENAIRILEL